MVSPHAYYLQKAIDLAKLGLGYTGSNPLVGCVIVKNDKIIGQGYHEQYGGPHAEINALNNCTEDPAGADCYVTLEPCFHTGKTPPCVDSIINAKIKNIYISSLDPNPLVNNNSIKKLKNNNIKINLGLLEKSARDLNKGFFCYHEKKRPYVRAKWAMSLDGKTITHPEDCKNITSPNTQLSAHLLRLQSQAIIIGANTARTDNPKLSIRHPDYPNCLQPLRVIISKSDNLPNQPSNTLILNNNPMEILNILYQKNIQSVLIEGGMNIIQQFLDLDLVDEIHPYIAPVIISNKKSKIKINLNKITQINSDLALSAELNGNNNHV